MEKQGETDGVLAFWVVLNRWQVQNRRPVDVLAGNGTFFALLVRDRVDIRSIKTAVVLDVLAIPHTIPK